MYSFLVGRLQKEKALQVRVKQVNLFVLDLRYSLSLSLSLSLCGGLLNWGKQVACMEI